MFKQFLFIFILIPIFDFEGKSETSDLIQINFINNQTVGLPGQIINIPFFIRNNSGDTLQLNSKITAPEGWSLVTRLNFPSLMPNGQKFSVLSFQIPAGYPVGTYTVSVSVGNGLNSGTFTGSTRIVVDELEKVTLQLIESPERISAGEVFESAFLLQNQGNTVKKVFIETSNCDISGTPEIKLEPGESARFKVYRLTLDDARDARKEYYTVRTFLSGKVESSISGSYVVFPVKSNKIDRFFRFPVSASYTYLASNQEKSYKSAYQFELSGNGSIDPGGKHQLDFLARGPNNTNLSFLGMYEQYYISYSNKNYEISLGEKSYSFTPLTESSRFGRGIENKIKLNNGLSFGYTYVKPRFYNRIVNEMAFYTQFEKNRNNLLSVYYVIKDTGIEENTYLASVSSEFRVLEKTSVDLEVSRGSFMGLADNAFRTNINSQLSIFRFAGNYFYTGKNYPGYFSNTTFFSGTLSAQLTTKFSAGLSMREDFRNAQLDTLFQTAPFSKTFLSFINYNIASRAHIKLYWRDNERQDRLSADKFHYKTKSLNSQFNQKFKNIEYSILGEYGTTTNFLENSAKNQQNTYRGLASFSYRFNSFNSVRIFGSWSNINSFVSGEKRNLTAGLSAYSRITKKINANFHIQNAYDIDDYYRNRNLMQLNFDYNFHKNHSLILRSYYTLFQKQVSNPEFTFSATYSYKFGVPLKQTLKAGDINGRITNDDDEPVEGIVLSLQNKMAVTDKNGDFTFKSVRPGIHLLTIDQSKLGINEIPGIPTPIELEVIADRVTDLNFKITKGAKLSGIFTFPDPKSPAIEQKTENPSNIIIELKNDFKHYRILIEKDGSFSFPAVIPGKWVFKIYENSIPDGFETDQLIYNLDFNPGDQVNLQIEIKPKKRNIIFKPLNIAMPEAKTDNSGVIKLTATSKPAQPELADSIFYSIQIGVFRKSKKDNSLYSNGNPLVFEMHDNNLFYYFAGKYATYGEAKKEAGKLKKTYRGAFVVLFKEGKKQYIDTKQNK